MGYQIVFKPRRRIGSLEFLHLFIAWISLAFFFSFRFLLANLASFLIFFSISLIAVGSGFVLHELAHKYTAIRYGHWAEFRLSPQGLLLALVFTVATFGQFIFAAPGATVIIPAGYLVGFGLSKKENGIISLAGPITNLILAAVFYSLSFLSQLIQGSIAHWFLLLCIYGSFINVWLAAFNLIPIGVLDGRKIISWNPLVWSIVTIPSWAIVILFLLGRLF